MNFDKMVAATISKVHPFLRFFVPKMSFAFPYPSDKIKLTVKYEYLLMRMLRIHE